MAKLTRKQHTRYQRLSSALAEARHYGWQFRIADLQAELAVLDAVQARTTRQHVYRDQHDAHVQLWGAQMVTRTNLMSGGKFQERRDTPGYMSPASEAYWSM